MATFADIVYIGYPQSGKSLRLHWIAYNGSVPAAAGASVAMAEVSGFPGIYWARVPAWDPAWNNPAAIVEDQSLSGAGAFTLAKIVQLGNIVAVNADAQLTQNNTTFIASATKVTAPVDPNNDHKLSLVQGDDHTAGDRLPTWSLTGYNGPALTGCKLRFLPIGTYERRGDAQPAVLEKAGNLVQTGSSLSINVPLSAADTAKLLGETSAEKLTHQYQLIGTTAAGLEITLVLAPCTVLRRIAAAAA